MGMTILLLHDEWVKQQAKGSSGANCNREGEHRAAAAGAGTTTTAGDEQR